MAAFTAIAIASTVYSVYNQRKAGQEEKKIGQLEREASYDQANLIDWNAKVADLQAKDAVLRGDEEEQRIRMNLRGIIGSQRATRAASNVDISVGSAVDIQVDAARMAELDVLTTKNNAAREAWGYNVQAEDLRRQAAIVRKTGDNQARAGAVRQGQAHRAMFGTVLNTTTSLLQNRYGTKAMPNKAALASGNYQIGGGF